MSLIGILSSNLFGTGAAQTIQNPQNAPGNPTNFQQIKTEFEQLGQDLQSGNLAAAQKDYTALSQNVPSSAQAGNNPVLQALSQLGQDLSSGNLQAAQQDFATVQQDSQQQFSGLVHGHHGHHRYQPETSQSSSQQGNAIAQVFGTLAADLQSGNLSGAQSAFATLQNDLQQIGGYLPSGSGSSATSAIPAAGSLNVSA